MDRLIEFITNHLILSIALMVIIILIIQDLVETALRKYQTISPISAVSLMNQDATVIDVREIADYAKGHIETARSIPLGKLDERAAELEFSKNAPILVVCQAGTRSPEACKKLTHLGFEQVHLIEGGMTAWEENNFPITNDKKQDKLSKQDKLAKA